MLGDVQISLAPDLIAVLPCSEALDYGTDSGLYLYADLVGPPKRLSRIPHARHAHWALRASRNAFGSVPTHQ